MKLYHFPYSSASYRVRIALNLKNLPYEAVSVALLAGEQHRPDYKKLNPQGLVPTLIDQIDGRNYVLTQSMATIEYLEERFPEPALLPADLGERAWIRSFCASISSEIQPLNNLRVHQYLHRQFGLSEDQVKKQWYPEWIGAGLKAMEATVHNAPRPGPFCLGDTPTMADVFLVPQLFNARRNQYDLSDYPKLVAIEKECMKLPGFIDAAPEGFKKVA